LRQYRLGEGPYGSAYRGSIEDLLASGDLQPIDIGDRTFGLFLGQFDWQQSFRHTWQEALQGLSAWLSGGRVTREHIETVPQIQDLRFTGDQHHLIVASSGAGKFRDILSNMLLYDGSCETACLIIDPKGEIASTIGPMMDAPGAQDPRTVILDPWDLTKTGKTDSLTLLDSIRSDNPHCMKDARVLAEALIVERGSDEGHWVATAKTFLTALLLYIGLDPIENDARTLFRLREIVTLTWNDLSDLLGYLSDSALMEGIVARTARAMLNRDEKERRAILSTLERDTAFVEDPSLWKAIKTSSFDMNQLVLTNKRLHVIVPFDYTDQMSSWLRLSIAAFYNACLRVQLPANWPTYLRFRHIIIDEFPGLGKLDFIMKGIAEARGAGIKYHLVVQNFPQLHHLYREGWENIVSNSFIHAFGVNDNFTAEYLSKMTGQATVVTESKGISESTTEGFSSSTGTSSSRTSGNNSSSSTWGQSRGTTKSFSRTMGTSATFSSTGRPVLMPDEIRRISGRDQLLFVRGMPVLLTRRTPYFQTFERFLPRHSLRDALTNRQAGGDQRSLIPVAGGALTTRGPLSSVNSFPRGPTFSPPEFRPYTFFEALLQSPGVMIAMACVVLLLLWWIPHEISSAAEQHRLEAIAQEEAARSNAARAEANRIAALQAEEERKAAIENETQARAIDDRLRGSYPALANTIYGAISRAGMCTAGSVGQGFSCSTSLTYAPGDLAPINLNLNVGRRQFVTLSVSPQNERRNASFTGVTASLRIESVFETVDMSSADPVRFNPAFRSLIASMFQAFGVSSQVLNICRTNSEGFNETVGGVNVSCQFTGRPPTTGGLAQFTLNLARRM
jgi:type IV secretory pathway TraG/TraD family ATPase VirD4